MSGSHFLMTHATHQAMQWQQTRRGFASWLGPRERDVLYSFRNKRRRDEWVCGRVLAKQIILRHFQSKHPCRTNDAFSATDTLQPRLIEIVSRDNRGKGIRPRVLLNGRLQDWSVAIAHTDDLVVACISIAPNFQMGVDVVPLTNRNRSLAIWMTEREQEWLRNQDSHAPLLLWGAKEAIYKATNVGEPFVPRHIEICPVATEEYECRVRGMPRRGLTLDIAYVDRSIVIVAALKMGLAPIRTIGACPIFRD